MVFFPVFQEELGHAVICGSVFPGKHGLIPGISVLKGRKLLVDVPYIAVGIGLGILHQLLIGCIRLQVFVGRRVIRTGQISLPVLFGEHRTQVISPDKIGEILIRLLFILGRRIFQVLVTVIGLRIFQIVQIRGGIAVAFIFGLQVLVSVFRRIFLPHGSNIGGNRIHRSDIPFGVGALIRPGSRLHLLILRITVQISIRVRKPPVFFLQRFAAVPDGKFFPDGFCKRGNRRRQFQISIRRRLLRLILLLIGRRSRQHILIGIAFFGFGKRIQIGIRTVIGLILSLDFTRIGTVGFHLLKLRIFCRNDLFDFGSILGYFPGSYRAFLKGCLHISVRSLLCFLSAGRVIINRLVSRIDVVIIVEPLLKRLIVRVVILIHIDHIGVLHVVIRFVVEFFQQPVIRILRLSRSGKGCDFLCFGRIQIHILAPAVRFGSIQHGFIAVRAGRSRLGVQIGVRTGIAFIFGLQVLVAVFSGKLGPDIGFIVGNRRHHFLIGCILRQIVFYGFIHVSVLIREPFFKGFFAALRLYLQILLILRPYFRLIIGCILLQTLNIGAFVVFRAGNQARIDPMVNQIVLIHIVHIILPGQCVDQAARLCFQAHVACLGNYGSYTHIPVFFRQIDMLLRLRVDTSRILTGSECCRNRIHEHSPIRTAVFLPCADAAICAGQPDIAAPYGCGVFRRDPGKFLSNLFCIDLFLDASQPLIGSIFLQIGVHIGVKAAATRIGKLLFQRRIPGKLIFHRLPIVGSIGKLALIDRVLGQIGVRGGKARKFTG